MAELRVLSLFAGIGGFDLGLEWAGGFKTVRAIEIDDWCRRVLALRFPEARIDGDITQCEFEEGEADVIVGGFPCIDISRAGNKVGIDGEHSGLWRDYARAIRVVQPRWVVIENVSDLLHRGMGRVLGDLAALGYDAEWHAIPAAYAGSPQGRDRVWIVAYPRLGGRQGRAERDIEGPRLVVRADHDGLGLAQRRARDALSWVRRADERTTDRVDRLRACGNIAHPAVVRLIGEAIQQAEAQAA